MKRCSRCGETKPLTKFNKNRSTKDGLSVYCKPCHRNAQRRYSKNHRHLINKNTRARRARQGKRLVDFMGGACADCGLVHPIFDVYCFHHLNPAEKETAIALLLGNSSWERITEEVSKTVMLCLNCHAVRHYNIRKQEELKNDTEELCSYPPSHRGAADPDECDS